MVIHPYRTLSSKKTVDFLRTEATYHNMIMCLVVLLAIPMTKASTERSFSVVRRMRTYLQSTKCKSGPALRIFISQNANVDIIGVCFSKSEVTKSTNIHVQLCKHYKTTTVTKLGFLSSIWLKKTQKHVANKYMYVLHGVSVSKFLKTSVCPFLMMAPRFL